MKSTYLNLQNLTSLIVVAAFMVFVSGCQSEQDKQKRQELKKQQLEERRLAARDESEKQIEEALSKGALLLSKTAIGDVVIETYEIPRPQYFYGTRLGLARDICVVYLRRNSAPAMSCYSTEKSN